MSKFTPEFICKQREIMALATPGPWEGNTDWNYRHKKIYSSDKEDKAVLAFHGVEAWSEGPNTYGETLNDVEQQARADASATSTAVDNYPAALDEIERLQAELDKHRWIPVSERLPEEEITVLMTNGRAVETGAYAEEQWWQHGRGGLRITHWRPLPEPPFDGVVKFREGDE